ncbi:hypothetical protein [Rhodoferax antarcticus]|uniref:Uncharacterized protein n=1 Tax=Rhodoferax antarcticus ANT.BR TaxID=1111071 RepID=A0A1Q8Y985_9BURK|nr:hypothetical protein [Rhodoferax antarcticus]OLP04497.1 hypothetical protein BLL52_4253 [Rhodoferax antarcticus ANT.BR]
MSSFDRHVVRALIRRGWVGSAEPAIASRPFMTAIGEKTAFAYLGPDDGYNRTLFAVYESEGRNILEPHGVLIPKFASFIQAHNLANEFAVNVDRVVANSYAGNLYDRPQPNAGLALVGMLIDAAHASVDELKDRISNVRDAPLDVAVEKNCECIYFDLDGVTHLGELRGRNRDFCITLPDRDSAVNKAIACRVFLDRHATKIESANAG